MMVRKENHTGNWFYLEDNAPHTLEVDKDYNVPTRHFFQASLFACVIQNHAHYTIDLFFKNILSQN